jgi:hypothetical protein
VSRGDVAKGIGVGVVTGFLTAATPAEAVMANSSLTDPAKEAGMSLVENLETAAAEGAGGIREGEEAAEAEPLAEPESAVHSDPPEGVDIEAFAESWSNEDAAEVLGDPSVFDGPDAGDPSGDVGGIF